MPSRLIECLGTTEEIDGVFSDAALLGALIRFEVALAAAQARLGIIPERAAEVIALSAKPDDFDPVTIAREGRDSATFAIPFVRALTARVEAIDKASATYVHWGATSQDLVDSAFVMLLAQSRVIMERDHRRIEASLRDLSDQHSQTVMLARTLLQPALPTTFGYKVAGWLGGLVRSWSRLERSFGGALQLQFGGAAGTLASYGGRGPELAAEIAKDLNLGLPDAPWHTQRDRLAGLIADCGVYAGSLGKIARDISLLMQDEVGEVAERGGGSSAMPNKRNPSASTIILAAATRLPGLISSYLAGMVQEHERAAGGWQAEWPTLVSAIQQTASAMAALAHMIGGLKIDAERMRANIDSTRRSILAEKAVMLLAPKIGKDAARALLADTSRKRPLAEILGELLTPEQIEALERPEDYLGAAEVFRRRLIDKE